VQRNVNIVLTLAFNKMILKGITGRFRAGTCTAILGPSGSGKTTLLNYLGARMSSNNLSVSGELYINGNAIKSIDLLKHRFSYVMQDDILYEDLTVREQLYSIAQLSGIQDPTEKVNEILRWLNLVHCSHTLIGNELRRGISGGERKRTSIASELITDPSVIFFDEPTTGLDSKNALDIAGIIKMFAKKGRTVIATIHQPSSDIMNKFDEVICMCKGEIVYYGSPHNIPVHFSSIGYTPPPHSNPADYLMSILNKDLIRIQALEEGRAITDIDLEELFQQRIDLFVSVYQKRREEKYIKRSDEADLRELFEDHRNQGFIQTILILLKRFYLFSIRNPGSLLAKLVKYIFVIIVNTLLYVNTRIPEEDTLASIQDVNAMIFTFVVHLGLSAITGAFLGIIPQISRFKQDHHKRLYSPTTFYLLSSLYQLPLFLVLIAVYVIVSCCFLDLNTGDNWSLVPMWYLIVVLVYISAMGIGDLISVLLRDIQLANQMFPIFVVPLFLSSGFIGVAKDFTFYLFYYSYISPFRFGFQAAALNQYRNSRREYYMEVCNVRPDGCFSKDCAIKMDNFAGCDPFNYLDFVETNIWTNIIVLIIQIIFYRLLSIFIFAMAMRDTPIQIEELPADNTFDLPKRIRDQNKIIAQLEKKIGNNLQRDIDLIEIDMINEVGRNLH